MQKGNVRLLSCVYEPSTVDGLHGASAEGDVIGLAVCLGNHIAPYYSSSLILCTEDRTGRFKNT